MFVPDPFSALRLSLIVALWCVILSFPAAVGIGWLLARGTFRGRALLSTLVLAPLVVPPVVTGLLLLRVLGPASPLGKALEAIGLPVAFTLAGAVLAAFIVGLPLFVLAARAAFEAVDPRYEELSLTLGVPPVSTFRRVTVPLALPGLAAGAVLTFARALGEFGATAVISGNVEGETRTLAMAVYTLLDSPGGARETVLLVAASIVLSGLALLGYELLTRRQRERLEVARDRS